MQVRDHVRLKASGFIGTIESTTEQGGESFYNVRCDSEVTELVEGSPDSEVIVRMSSERLELIP